MVDLALLLGGLALLVYARVEYIRRYIAKHQAVKRLDWRDPDPQRLEKFPFKQYPENPVILEVYNKSYKCAKFRNIYMSQEYIDDMNLGREPDVD